MVDCKAGPTRFFLEVASILTNARVLAGPNFGNRSTSTQGGIARAAAELCRHCQARQAADGIRRREDRAANRAILDRAFASRRVACIVASRRQRSRQTRPGQEDRTWHAKDVNRIAGAMENPLIPKSSRYVNDRNFGVFLDQSAWTLGVQIKVPLSITNPRDDDGDDDDPEDFHDRRVKATMMLPPEEVFAPVSGQVVWAKDYTFRKPPCTDLLRARTTKELLPDDPRRVVHRVPDISY